MVNILDRKGTLTASSKTNHASLVSRYKRKSILKRPRRSETLAFGAFAFCGLVTVAITIFMVVFLFKEALPFFTETKVGVAEFLFGQVWQPASRKFGLLPLVTATFVTSIIALTVATPAGIGVAIYLGEYASPKFRAIIKPVIELLAGVPTVVFGFFAVFTITPFLRSLFGNRIQFQNTLAAGMALGFLLIPTIASMTEDALSAVSIELKEAAYGMASTKLEVLVQIIIPSAKSGILAACFLALGRAIGETMIVAMAAGSGPQLTLNPLLAAETMTGHIARISGGELSYNSIDYQSLFAIGFVLFLASLIIQSVRSLLTRSKTV